MDEKNTDLLKEEIEYILNRVKGVSKNGAAICYFEKISDEAIRTLKYYNFSVEFNPIRELFTVSFAK